MLEHNDFLTIHNRIEKEYNILTQDILGTKKGFRPIDNNNAQPKKKKRKKNKKTHRK